MARKKRTSGEGFTFFDPTGSDNPIDGILSIIGNEIINLGIQKLSNKPLGLMGIGPIA